jgi:hypothetical protein
MRAHRPLLFATAAAAAAVVVVLAATVVPVVAWAEAQTPNSALTPAQAAGAGAVPAGCARPEGPRRARCYLAVERAKTPPPTFSTTSCTVDETTGYTACNIQSAYGLTSLSKKDGKGTTVAIVDAYDDPYATSDLAVYRTAEHLPACTTANGCFEKVDQGGVPGTYPTPTAGWTQEISLDLDMVSAVCPNCHILLVEADSSTFGDLAAAVDEAVALGAHVVSDSWGTDEFSGETGWDGNWDHPGIAITFSSGDGAYKKGVQYPSASPYVISVGGTMLAPASDSRGWTETVWVTPPTPATTTHTPKQGSGSGCSAYEWKPPWQTDTACKNRMTADVSAVAARVLAYDTYGGSGWYLEFGTSVSSPIVAAAYALAGNPSDNVVPASAVYAAPAADLHDITSGATGTCAPPSSHKYWCTAVKGYDGPTGRGSPHGIAAFSGVGSAPPSISSVTFSGSNAHPSVTVAGADLGSSPPSGQAAGCSTTGKNFGSGLNFADTAGGWGAGQYGDCVGLVVESWSPGSVTFAFGSGYASYSPLANGNAYTLEVEGMTRSGTVSSLTS